MGNRNFLVFGVTTAACLVVSDVSAQGLTRFNIIAECTQTIQQYAHYRDQLDAEGYSNLFTEDGVFVLAGEATTGRDAIAARIRGQDTSVIDRHMTGSIVVDADASSGITAKSYVYVYQADKPATPGPVPIGSYVMVEYKDQMRMTETGCKFIRREATPIFIGEE